MRAWAGLIISILGLLCNLYLYNSPAYLPYISEFGIFCGAVAFSLYSTEFIVKLFKKI